MLIVAAAAAGVLSNGGLASDDGEAGAGSLEAVEQALQEHAQDEAADALAALEAADETGFATELALEEAASELLGGYEAQGSCAVAQSGYVDLAGDVWGCVVYGEGWVDVCVVQEKSDGGSAVTVWRMEADDLRAAL